jgi:transposase
MKKIVRQVAGIDVAQKELVVTLGRMYDDWTVELHAHKVFPNTQKGFLTLVTWVNIHEDESAAVRYVMEATGVYHESLAYFLDSKGHEVSIVLPNKISNYFRTLEVKTITDKTASQAIARFGLERRLDKWKRPKEAFKQLRQLTRERDQLVQSRTVAKNQLHAEKAEAQPNSGSMGRLKRQIALFNKLELEVMVAIKKISGKTGELKPTIDLICTIPGVGLLTACTVLAETNGFELIRNKKQLTSYAGLDVKEKQSGTSVRGKSRISKRGNRYLRKAMHMPALAAIRHDERFKAVFARLISKHGIKMKAVVAVQRKLLEMIYTLFKSEKKYDKAFFQNQLQPVVAKN